MIDAFLFPEMEGSVIANTNTLQKERERERDRKKTRSFELII